MDRVPLCESCGRWLSLINLVRELVESLVETVPSPYRAWRKSKDSSGSCVVLLRVAEEALMLSSDCQKVDKIKA